MGSVAMCRSLWGSPLLQDFRSSSPRGKCPAVIKDKTIISSVVSPRLAQGSLGVGRGGFLLPECDTASCQRK